MSPLLSRLLDRLRARCARDRVHYLPFHPCSGQIRLDFAERLLEWPEVFHVTLSGVTLVPSLDTPALRTQALDAIVRILHNEGLVTGWRNEVLAVASAFGEQPLFHIERAALHFFGLPLHAVQVHGISDSSMWLARRSAGKPVDPGLLDTLVGGGIGNGLGVRDTLLKECEEEAGIDAAIASTAIAAGAIRTARPVRDGWHAEVQFSHDLLLPDDFHPVSRDGEVTEFVLLPLPEVLEMMADSSELTVEACAAIADFMLRTRFIAPDAPGAQALREFIR